MFFNRAVAGGLPLGIKIPWPHTFHNLRYGLPLLNGFVGEFTILQGAFEANRIWAAFAVSGLIFGAAYLLWLYQRTMLGQITNAKNLGLRDLNLREVALFLPLIAWAIWIGVYPKPYFDVLRQPVTQIVERVRPGYFAAMPQTIASPIAGNRSLTVAAPNDPIRDRSRDREGAVATAVSERYIAAPTGILARSGGPR